MAITVKGKSGRSVTLDSRARTVTVSLTGWRRLFGWRSKVKRGKRKGEPLSPDITFGTTNIRKVRARMPGPLLAGKLVIDAPGHNDHWTPTGRQRKHVIKFGSSRAREALMWLFGVDLLTGESVVDNGFMLSKAFRRLPDTVKRAGTPKPGHDRRRGERAVQLSDDPRFPNRVPSPPASSPAPAQRTGPVPVLPFVPPSSVISAAERARRRQRRAAGLPPA
jgi:hypothetical protein